MRARTWLDVSACSCFGVRYICSEAQNYHGVDRCPKWGYLARWADCAGEGCVSAVPGGFLVNERTCWCSGFFDDVKRWFKSITEGYITEVSSSRTPSGCTGKPLVLPGGTALCVSAAHLTHLVHGEVVSVPRSCCDCGELGGGTEGCPEGWNTPSTGVKPAWHSPMRVTGDSAFSRTATMLPSSHHREAASFVSAPWCYPFVISMICP